VEEGKDNVGEGGGGRNTLVENACVHTSCSCGDRELFIIALMRLTIMRKKMAIDEWVGKDIEEGIEIWGNGGMREEES